MHNPPLHPRQSSQVLNLFFTICFTVEISIKAVADNFFFGPNAFLKSGWGWIDFLATASGYLPYLMSDEGGLSGARALRALRPLRALTVIPGGWAKGQEQEREAWQPAGWARRPAGTRATVVRSLPLPITTSTRSTFCSPQAPSQHGIACVSLLKVAVVACGV